MTDTVFMDPDEAWLDGEQADSLYETLMGQVSSLEKRGLGRHDWWRLKDKPKDEPHQLLFGTGLTVHLECDIVYLGTVSHRTGSWMWAWHNEVLFPTKAIRNASKKVAAKAAKLTKSPMFKTAGVSLRFDTDGFRLAAACCKAIDAQVVYRMPNERTDLYVLLTDIRDVEYDLGRTRREPLP